MSQTQQLVPQLAVFFNAVAYLALAVFVCIAFYKYVAAAVETRSIFHTRVRMAVPLAVLFIGPRMALRQFDVPKSVASGLETVSMLALLVIMVLGLRMMIGLFSQLFTSTPRNP
jgi:hypothetical protein